MSIFRSSQTGINKVLMFASVPFKTNCSNEKGRKKPA
ncbi:hypothetical protein BDE36_3027 [Arcticibacter tournemirensis]|nr:hypothetical protein BDE36_3027 [Arcticibacter tournemirensis]